jgi:hypothetical protein
MNSPSEQPAPQRRWRLSPPPWLVRHAGALCTLAFVLPFVWPKIRYAAGTRDFSTDGGHYADVAMHLADGDGFTTSLSVLHQGYTYFPHPSSIYPAWPMLMAAAIKLTSLRFAAVWLPTLLYFTTLLVASMVGRRIAPLRFPRPFAFLDGGHALLLCFLAAKHFFNFTSRPYTEGLSFLVALLFLWRAGRLFSALTWRAGVEIGLWLALLLYCRSHFIVFVLALVVAAALEALLRVRDRAGGLVQLAMVVATALAAASLAFLPFYLFLASFLPDFGLNLYFRFDLARETPFLSLIIRMDRMDLLSTLLDRARGTLLAFDPTWSHSYFRSFGLVAYLLPLALLAALVAPRDARERLLRMLGERETRLFRLYLVVLAAGALASIHAVHKDFSYEWYFSSRHSVICTFAFFLAALFALGSKQRWIAWLAMLMMVVGAAGSLQQAFRAAKRPPDDFPEAKPVVAWLTERTGSEPLIVAGDSVYLRRAMWRLPAEQRRRIGVHTLYKRSSLDDLRVLTTRLGARYIVVTEGGARAQLLEGSGEFHVADIIDVPDGRPRLLVFAPGQGTLKVKKKKKPRRG